VESALIEHPAVAESAVVSSPDETRGEIVKAFVVLTNDYQSSEDGSGVKRSCQSRHCALQIPAKAGICEISTQDCKWQNTPY